MHITRKSLISGIERTLDIPVTHAQLEAWHRGMLIQNAMPNLTVAEREFLISGATQEEWDIVISPPTIEDDGEEDE